MDFTRPDTDQPEPGSREDLIRALKAIRDEAAAEKPPGDKLARISAMARAAIERAAE